MACSRPLTVARPGFSDKPSLLLSGVKPYRAETLTVPCGKCFACLKDRQSNLSVRCYEEARSKGSMVFVTLTYDEDHLPLCQRLCVVDRDTGELDFLSEPEIMSVDGSGDLAGSRFLLASIRPSSFPRYLDIPLPFMSFFEPEKEYFYRITPSVNKKDVQDWLKRCRISYERKVSKLPKFTYVCVPEYGPRTCRPHYHLAFFGLSVDIVRLFCDSWHFGYTKVENVAMVNKDGSSGFMASARYIGKYMSKGTFECESVKDCFAKKCRISSSKGFGSSLMDYQAYVMAYDLFGPYDPDTLRLNHGCGSRLTLLQLQKLIEVIPSRLVYSYDGKHYFAFPRQFRKKFFYVETLNPTFNTVVNRPSALWLMVSDSIRRKYEDILSQEFRQVVSGVSFGTVPQVVSKFNHEQEITVSSRELAYRQACKQSYEKSVF